MRACWLLVALAIVLGTIRPARADVTDEITVLTPPPVPPLGTPPPELTAGPDLTPFLGSVVESVDVTIDPDDARIWPDVKVPPVGTLKPGDPFHRTALRDAIAEVLATGSFADARAELLAGANGVKVSIRVIPRKVIDGIRINLHGAPLDGDEILRDLDIVTDGEVVASELAKQSTRLEAILHRHGFPAPSVAITTVPLTNNPLRVRVDVSVTAGAPRKIERRVIYAEDITREEVGSSRVDLQACKLEYSIVSPK